MLSKNILRLLVSFVFLGVLAFPLSAVADVVLDPGYITGAVNVGGYTPYNTYVSASGNGYSSSKSSSGSNYSLTVQGGDWDYNISMRAYFRPTTSSYPYTYVYFNNRSFSVPVGETVTNDYITEGATVRFHVNITGDAYDNWYANGYAYKNVSPGVGETTQSYGYMYNYSMSNAVWDMVVIPNEQTRIYAYVRVMSGNNYKYYYFWYDYPDYRYEDIASGDVLDVYLDITHDDTDDTTHPSEYGTVEGIIQLNNVDSFYRHYVQGGGDSFYVTTNPGAYVLDQVTTGDQYFYAYSYFDNSRTYFRWPYTGGDSLNDRINIEAGGSYYKDFIADAGTLQSKLKFSGTVNDEELYYKYLYVDGIYQIYDPIQGWVRQPTYGGYAYQYKYNTDPDPSDIRLFLTPGPWNTYRSYAQHYDYDSGYYKSYQLYIYDYNYYYEGSSYNFGQNAIIAAGATTVQDKNYCTGALVLRYRVAGGGLVSNPNLNGYGYHYREDGKRDLQANIYGNSNVYQAEDPTVTVHGPEADYNLTPSFTAEDGSQINFTPVQVELECNVWKGLDLNGPTIKVTYPLAGLITNAQSVTVTGTVTDETGVSSVTVNGNDATLTSDVDPDDPNKVGFTYELPVVNGENVVNVAAVDTVLPDGNEASDIRSIFVDHWIPSASIVQPTDSYFSGFDTNIPVEVTAADQGYGFSVEVSLDGSSICQADGAANAAAYESVSCRGTIPGPLSSGDHVISATVTDIVGNSTTASKIIHVDGWIPTVKIVQPADSYFSHIQTDIPVEVLASDRGYRLLNVVVSLDGTEICQESGLANDAASVDISCATTIPGPLSVGIHEISATVTDAAGNANTVSKMITSYLAADLTVKPEARHNLTEGTSSIFVTLPDGLTATASLTIADNREISSGTAINPREVRYNSGDDKLIQKYDRTPDLMGDELFIVEGIFCPNPADPAECYTWRGSDTTKW
jgi:hypothetical protein